ncbi:MAG TPA: hypothetical protein VGE68_06215 [Sphingomicrobium sp.]
MDLNYLFHRQQVERSLADAATSETARKAHQELAGRYEDEIRKARETLGADEPLFQWPPDEAFYGEKANAPMAAAMTARRVGGGKQA